MALALVTLNRAKTHLRVTDNAHDDDITQKMTAASDEIVRYLDGAADDTWDPVDNPAPPTVEHAILLLTSHYFWSRGDVMTPDADVWLAIQRLLAQLRTPVVS